MQKCAKHLKFISDDPNCEKIVELRRNINYIMSMQFDKFKNEGIKDF
jgi:hypothetical protein